MTRVTQAAIDAAILKHEVVYVLEVANKSVELNLTDTEGKVIETAEGDFVAQEGYSYAVLHSPDKRTLGFAMTHRDPIQLGNALLKNCIVTLEKDDYLNDDAIMNDDDVNIAAALEVTQLFDIRAAKLKKFSRVSRK
jgi:hypothetical protein